MSIPPLELILHPPTEQDGQTTYAASTTDPQNKTHTLWFKIPTEFSSYVTHTADPFIVGFLFPALQWRRPLHVRAQASPTLLRNLEKYMAIWHAWKHETYQPIHITADDESEPPPPTHPSESIMAFSGGLDATFTALRHHQKLAGRQTHNITAGLTIHGFDIWLDEPNSDAMYQGLLTHCKHITTDLNMQIIPIQTNYHDLQTHWPDSHGTHLYSNLLLFQKKFAACLTNNGLPYLRLNRAYGLHPVLDPLLSTAAMKAIDDGGEFDRWHKAKLVSQSPAASKWLRVCFQNPGQHTNCGKCTKCIRTTLSFRAAGCPCPPCFPADVTDGQIKNIRLQSFYDDRMFHEIIRAARLNNLSSESWVRAIHTAIRRNKIRRAWARLKHPFIPLRDFIKYKILRRTPKNKNP